MCAQGYGAQTPQPSAASGQLGKEQAIPSAEHLFSRMKLESVMMTARLMTERTQLMLFCLNSFRVKTVVPLKQFQQLLGHIASSAVVTPLGLMHMRLLQHWLQTQVPRWAWHRGTLRVAFTPICCHTFSRGSLITSVQVYCGYSKCVQVRLGHCMQWACSFGCIGTSTELLAVLLALQSFRLLNQGKHVSLIFQANSIMQQTC